MGLPRVDAVALVTGASSGIGAALARQLGPRGGTLVLVARREARLRDLARELGTATPGLRVDVRPCDLSDPAQVAALAAGVLADHGRVDILVNNAGLGQAGRLVDTDPAHLHRMLMVNVVALTELTRAVLPGMVARGRGGVLNVSSGFGLTWMPLFAAYVGTKHHVTAMTESLRVELAGTGVHVSQLCPGPVRTEFEANLGEAHQVPIPGFVQITAERCAAAGLRGLDRDRAMVIPGLLAWAGIKLGERTPRWVLRLWWRALWALGGHRLQKSPTEA